MLFQNSVIQIGLFILSLLILPATLKADEPPQKPSRPPGNAMPAAANPNVQESVMKALAEAWPNRPEWLDMYTDILAGSQLGPNDGWFRRSVSRTRFDWISALKRFDRDGNQEISRAEFSGSDNDFARLDRDRDRLLTIADFDFQENALAPTPGSMFFRMMDRDGNGKVTMTELDGFFKRADTGSMGFISLADMKLALDPKRPATASKSAGSKPPQAAAEGPSKETLIKGLFQQEIGSLQDGPALNEKARDFTLKTNDAKQQVTLSKLVGPKPVVLIFGNFTCGPFRMQAGNVEKLYRRYKDRATFVMVYVREAHPSDGWQMESNDQVGVRLTQPKTYDERVQVAQVCGQRLELGFPMLVDTMEDTVGAYFSGMPSRLYLIDSDGKIAFKNARGPFGFKPEELEQSLVLMLQQTPAKN